MRQINPRKHGDEDGVQVVTEPRGGWDEWSDEWRHIIEVILPNGETRNDKLFKDEFETEEGISLHVEIPSRLENDVRVEQYEPEYDYEYMSLREFNSRLESGEIRQV